MTSTFQNVYYKRAVATEKPCYVCLRPTTVVLATINAVDFLYTCESHLTDRGFATQISSSEVKPNISQEEIDRVKKEWEEKQAQKKAKDKEKEKGKDKDKSEANDQEKEKEKEKKGDDQKSAESSSTKGSSGSPNPASESSSTPIPSHQKYVLHRDMFVMRQDEHRRKRQAKQVKEVAPKLPIAPKGNVF